VEAESARGFDLRTSQFHALIDLPQPFMHHGTCLFDRVSSGFLVWILLMGISRTTKSFKNKLGSANTIV
jgi:hypothetical protein